MKSLFAKIGNHNYIVLLNGNTIFGTYDEDNNEILIQEYDINGDILNTKVIHDFENIDKATNYFFNNYRKQIMEFN